MTLVLAVSQPTSHGVGAKAIDCICLYLTLIHKSKVILKVKC